MENRVDCKVSTWRASVAVRWRIWARAGLLGLKGRKVDNGRCTKISRHCLVEFRKNWAGKVQLCSQCDPLHCATRVWWSRRQVDARRLAAQRGRQLLHNHFPRLGGILKV